MRLGEYMDIHMSGKDAPKNTTFIMWSGPGA